MNCTPAKCPHRALLEKARAACLACNHIAPAGHGGTISYEAAGELLVERQRLDAEDSLRKHAAQLDGEDLRTRATQLPEAVEEKLRLLLHTVTGLDTVDALLALHVANGGTCTNFGDYLLRLATVIRLYNPRRKGFRATASSRWEKLKLRFAPFGVLQSWEPANNSGARLAAGKHGNGTRNTRSKRSKPH